MLGIVPVVFYVYCTGLGFFYIILHPPRRFLDASIGILLRLVTRGGSSPRGSLGERSDGDGDSGTSSETTGVVVDVLNDLSHCLERRDGEGVWDGESRWWVGASGTSFQS